MKHITLSLMFSLIMVFAGCMQEKSGQNQDKDSTFKADKQEIKYPVEIKLHVVNGDDIVLVKDKENLKIKGLNDKLILLDFFATWCPPCKAEIPHLVNLQKKYKNDLKIVSVLLEDGKPDSEIKSFIKYHGINYIVTNDKNNYKLSSLLGEISNIPFMILYDKNGTVITHYLGAIPEEMINSDIKKAIK
ncbi:MAG: TlpA family protein disulfide reductase [Epsilonproteobacteria bacterium]|nr:TlpA family protein disulfide reductase [Campylobacterota bacterium]